MRSSNRRGGEAFVKKIRVRWCLFVVQNIYFPHAKRIRTAELPEAVDLSASGFHYEQINIQEIVGPEARHS